MPKDNGGAVLLNQSGMRKEHELAFPDGHDLATVCASEEGNAAIWVQNGASKQSSEIGVVIGVESFTAGKGLNAAGTTEREETSLECGKRGGKHAIEQLRLQPDVRMGD